MVIYRAKKSKINIIENVLRYRRYILLKLKCKKAKMGKESFIKKRRETWKIYMMIRKMNIEDKRINCGSARKGYLKLLYKIRIKKKFNSNYEIKSKSEKNKKRGVIYV